MQIVDTLVDYPQAHQQLNGGGGGGGGGSHHVHHLHQRSEPPPGHYHQQQQRPPVASPPLQRCQCCPFGFHIDLDFVKFAEDVASGKEQIQNWSSPDKKRARRLMASPSSDRTMLDISGGSDAANVSSPYPNDSSLMSKSLEVDELPDVFEQHSITSSSPYTNGSSRPRAPSVPTGHHQQHHLHQQPQGILKNTGDWQQRGTPNNNNFPPRTTPMAIGNRGQYQQTPVGSPGHGQQQHQSRFYEAHVQQQMQQRRRPPQPSPPAYLVGSPLRTSTPRTNDEVQQILFAGAQHRPLHISTTMVNASGHGSGSGGTNSAPSSPVPKPPYQTTIAQSLAHLRKTPQKGVATATYFGTPQTAHTSLSALSSAARHAFTNPPITSARHHFYLESGGPTLMAASRRPRVLSPEPHLGLPSLNTPLHTADGRAVRSSNLQSRQHFFHQQNNNNGSANSNGTRVPYRSRATGGGSVPHLGSSTPSLELAEFASVRRRRLDADIGGSATLQSAHLVRSVSPPLHLPLSTASTSLPRQLAQQHANNIHSFSMANLDHQHQQQQQQPQASSAQFYDDGTLKATPKSSKSRHKEKQQPKSTAAVEYQIPVKSVQATVLRTSGTQTPPTPTGREIGIGTESSPRQVSPPRKPPPPPKKEFREIGTSPAEEPPPLLPTQQREQELPFAGLFTFASVGVDTRDLPKSPPPPTTTEEKAKSGRRKSGPPPPPKPSGPHVEAELQRRRQAELLGSLVAEFQYCLGHEPEHHPGEEPPLLERRKSQAEQLQPILPPTVDRGVDAISFARIHQQTMGTSTTDLAASPSPTVVVDTAVGPIWALPEMVEKGMETEEQMVKETNSDEVAIQTEEPALREAQVGTEPILLEQQLAASSKQLADAEAQTEAGWLETEVGRRLAQAETERREKRKRNSVERGTETDEDEAPDQFIMITCNKCEQRSSVASDELFEKIVVPSEADHPIPQMDLDSQAEPQQLFEQQLETVREEEPELIVMANSQEGAKTIMDLDMAEQGGIVDQGVAELLPEWPLRKAAEFESVEMRKFVADERLTNVQEKEEDEIAEGVERGTADRQSVFLQQQQHEEGQTQQKLEAEAENERILVVEQQQQTDAAHRQKHEQQKDQQHDQQQSFNVLSSSPLSSDEGLVLAEEDFEVPEELDVEMDTDRVSIETDAQTVICVEPSSISDSSAASSSSKTPTEPSCPGGASGGEYPSARTEALRKLLCEPQRQPFQRDTESNRSYRSDRTKAQQMDLEYIADRHKSTDAQQLQSEPSTPTSTTQTRKALKEAINLKKSPASTFASCSSSSAGGFPPDPIPAKIPRPKIARYSPNVVQAETPDEEAEAHDRLTPLRSEMRSLAAWGGSGSPRLSQRTLIFRTQIGGPLEEEDEELDLDAERPAADEQPSSAEAANATIEEDASSTSSEGARTYEMSEEENAEFFELSAPLRDALETINDYLLRGSKTPTSAEVDNEQQNKQIEWAHKYAQHEWLKMATKKNANAELVEHFIDALEAQSTQLMDTVVNMTDQNGNTALHYAVSNENFDVISVLLDSKVCRVDQMNKAGYSALMLGALCELNNETECAIMQRLFQMGNVNAKAVKHSQTALMLAASHGRVEATNLLLKCGADVNIQDVDGSTALMCAAEHGQKEIVKLLLKQPNVDASLTDCDSQTALSIAVENQHRDIGVLIYAHLNFSRLAEMPGESSVSI